jgi:hypothetical protein
MLENFIRNESPKTKLLKPVFEGPSYRRSGAASLLLLLCFIVPGLVLSGCSSSSSLRATAGPINFINSSGASEKLSVLAIASAVKLSMMPSGDTINAGVDWVVTCGGNPVTGSIANGSCGTLSPVHTADGQATTYTAPSVVPINASITITATVTSNPSQSSSVSFTIVAAPIGVALSTIPAPTPNSLLVNTQLSFTATVTNDPLNAGVIYTATCGSSACGSFNPIQVQSLSNSIYTAPSIVPSGNTVTITATSVTDTSKSASATLTITTPSAPPPVTVSVVPSSLYAQTSGSVHTVHFTAVVANDPQAAGVDWSVQCGASACGTITPAHTASGTAATYAAPAAVPPGGTVTVTAKSTVNPAVSASATANIVTAAPIVVTISMPTAPSLPTGTQATLAATTTNDTGNLGVNWTASCGSASACGSFNLSPAHTASGGQIVYTAPAAVPSGGLVTITASSPASTPSNPGIALTTIVAQPPSVSFQQTPPSALMSVAQAAVSATVANDVPPGGVTWSVQCGSTVPGGCGWIAPLQTASGATATYTAPPVTSTGTSVTITATSVADPGVNVSSSPIAINPSSTPSVSFIPSLPSQMQLNATVSLEAAVANDTTNAGVDWQVCASGCGFFIIKPAIPAIPATATTPYAPPVPAVTATTVSAWPNGLPIPYTAPPQSPSVGTVAIEAIAHADSTKATSGAITISSSPTGPALNGVVQAGVQPVVGASVSLYAAGISGYASAASSIATATTGKNGSFTIPATYSCPSLASQMYLVATGGKTGSNAANPNLALMTALGNCSSLGSAPLVVNEVTTVASAYATSQFAGNDALTGNTSYLYLGTSSGNSAGLANAFAAVNNLVDITTGQARFFVPSGNAAAPYVAINTLADMLNSCTATSGGVAGDGSACGTLFNATDILPQHSLYNSVAPTDTLQAVFNIAQHPIGNYGYVLSLPNLGSPSSLASSSSPFQPILSTSPNDWSLSLNYTVGAGLSSSDALGSFAIDAGGNLWITDKTAESVIEWNATGAAISTSAGYPAGGGPIAIDSTGNVWISGNNSLSELTSFGIAAPGSPFAGVSGGGSDTAFDAQDNLWIANGAGVSEFSNLGVTLSPEGGYTNSGVSGISAVGVDSTNNIWVGFANSTQNNIAIITNPGGQLITPGGSSSSGNALPQMAADGSGDMWDVTQTSSGNSSVCKTPPYAGKGSQLTASCSLGGSIQNAGTLPFFDGQGIALDGAGTVWLASAGGGGTLNPPSVLPIEPMVTGSAGPQGSYASPSLAAGTVRLGIDGSGNIWVLLANNTITEYIGAAAPTANPTGLALKSKKLGAKP